MRRGAIISALLLVSVGVVLGATVFRANIAQATGLKQSQPVTVDNTPAEAVPVREQNTDSSAGGAIKVHEQGTLKVTVSNNSSDNVPYQHTIFFTLIRRSAVAPCSSVTSYFRQCPRVSA
jgi:hypothetical protein